MIVKVLQHEHKGEGDTLKLSFFRSHSTHGKLATLPHASPQKRLKPGSQCRLGLSAAQFKKKALSLRQAFQSRRHGQTSYQSSFASTLGGLQEEGLVKYIRTPTPPTPHPDTYETQKVLNLVPEEKGEENSNTKKPAGSMCCSFIHFLWKIMFF